MLTPYLLHTLASTKTLSYFYTFLLFLYCYSFISSAIISICPDTDLCCRSFLPYNNSNNPSAVSLIANIGTHKILCPSDCLTHLSSTYNISTANNNLPLYGSGPYHGNSSVCLAAIHRNIIDGKRGGMCRMFLFNFTSIYSSYFPLDSRYSSTRNNVTSNSIDLPYQCTAEYNQNNDNINPNCPYSFIPISFGPFVGSALPVPGLDLTSLQGVWITQFIPSPSIDYFLFGGKSLTYLNSSDSSAYNVVYSDSIYRSTGNDLTNGWRFVGRMPFGAAYINALPITQIQSKNNTFESPKVSGYIISSYESGEICGQPICSNDLWWVRLLVDDSQNATYVSPQWQLLQPYIYSTIYSRPNPRCGSSVQMKEYGSAVDLHRGEITISWFFGQLSANHTVQQICQDQILNIHAQSMNIDNSIMMSNMVDSMKNDISCCICTGNLSYPVTYLKRYIIVDMSEDRQNSLLIRSDTGVMERNFTDDDITVDYVDDRWNLNGRMNSMKFTQTLSSDQSVRDFYFAGGISLTVKQSNYSYSSSFSSPHSFDECKPRKLARLPIQSASIYSELFVTSSNDRAKDQPSLQGRVRLCGSIPLAGFQENHWSLDISGASSGNSLSYWSTTPRQAEMLWHNVTDDLRSSSDSYNHILTSIYGEGLFNRCMEESKISNVRQLRFNLPLHINLSTEEYWNLRRHDIQALAINSWQTVPLFTRQPYYTSFTPPSLSQLTIPSLQPTFRIPSVFLNESSKEFALGIPFHTCFSYASPQGSFLCASPQPMKQIASIYALTESLPIIPYETPYQSYYYYMNKSVCYPPSEYVSLLGVGYSTNCVNLNPEIFFHSNQTGTVYSLYQTCNWQCSSTYHLKPEYPASQTQSVLLTCMPDGTWADLTYSGVTTCVKDNLNCTHPLIDIGDEECVFPVPIIDTVKAENRLGSYSGCTNDLELGRVYDCSVNGETSITITGHYFQHPLLVLIGSYLCDNATMIDEENEEVVCNSFSSSICHEQPPCYRYTDTIECKLPKGVGANLPLLIQSNGAISQMKPRLISFAEPQLFFGCVIGCVGQNPHSAYSMIKECNMPRIMGNVIDRSNTSFYSSLLCPSFNLSHQLSDPATLYMIGLNIGDDSPPAIAIGSRICGNVTNIIIPTSNYYYITCTFSVGQHYGSTYTIAVTQEDGLGLTNFQQLVQTSQEINSKGTYMNNNAALTLSFQHCPAGTEFGGFDGNGRVVCNLCAVGYSFSGSYDSDIILDPRCSPCPPGYFADKEGSVTCTKCLSGTVGSNITGGSSFCLSCEAGSTSNDEGVVCIKCSAGQFSPHSGSSTCFDCPTETYSNTSGQTQCYDCPPNSWQPGLGEPKCNVCDSNTFIKFVSVLEPNPDGSNETSTRIGECYICPDGLTCLSTGILLADEGKWLYANQLAGEPQVFDCVASNICLDGKSCLESATSNSAIQQNNTQMINSSGLSLISCCSANRIPSANNILCAQCLPGYSEWGGICVDCSDPSYLIAIGFVFLLLLLVYALYRIQHCESSGLYSTGSDSAQLKILAYYIQLAAHFCRAESNTWVALIGLLTLQIGANSVPLSICVLPIQPIQHLLIKVLMPAVALVCLLFLFLLECSLKRVSFKSIGRNWAWLEMIFPTPFKQTRWALRNNYRGCSAAGCNGSASPYMRTAVYVIFFSYNTIAINTLSFFSYIKVGNQTVLADLPAVDVLSNEYLSLIPLFAFLLIFIVIGFPIFLIFFLYFHRERIQRIKHLLQPVQPTNEDQLQSTDQPQYHPPQLPNYHNLQHIQPQSRLTLIRANSDNIESINLDVILPPQIQVPQTPPSPSITSSNEVTNIPRSPQTPTPSVMTRLSSSFSRSLVSLSSAFLNVEGDDNVNKVNLSVLPPSDLAFFRSYSLLFSFYSPACRYYYQSYVLLRRVSLIAVTSTLLFDSAHQSQANSWASCLNLLFLFIHIIQQPFIDKKENMFELASLASLATLTVILTSNPQPTNDVGLAIVLTFLFLLPVIAWLLITYVLSPGKNNFCGSRESQTSHESTIFFCLTGGIRMGELEEDDID